MQVQRHIYLQDYRRNSGCEPTEELPYAGLCDYNER